MTGESLAKFAIPIVTFFGKLFIKDKERYDFQFLEKIFEKNQWEGLHDYVLSGVFKNQRGRDYDASMIRYLLSKPDSMRLFNDFDRGERHLNIQKSTKNGKNEVNSISLVEFLKDDDKTFKIMKRNRNIVIFLFMILGMLPILFLPAIKSIVTLLAVVLFMGMCFLGAYYMLGEIEALESAKRMSELN